MRVRVAAGLAAALLGVAGGLSPLACSPDGLEDPAPRLEDLRRQVEDLYRRAREAGDKVPGDAYEWAREDVDRIGDWEYRVVRLDLSRDDAELESRLDELGAERWEVFWLEDPAPGATAARVFLKRPTRTWLRHLPLSELGRLVPLGGGPG